MFWLDNIKELMGISSIERLFYLIKGNTCCCDHQVRVTSKNTQKKKNNIKIELLSFDDDLLAIEVLNDRAKLALYKMKQYVHYYNYHNMYMYITFIVQINQNLIITTSKPKISTLQQKMFYKLKSLLIIIS